MHKTIFKNAVLSALLAASVALNLAQMRELHRLGELSGSESRALLGLPAIRIAAQDLAGRPAVIEYSQDLPTVIYFFSPRCGWCTRNLPNVAALAAQASRRYRLVGLSTADEGLGEYAREHGWTFPVYSKPSPETIAYFRLQSTPKTIVVSPERRVLHSWAGAYANTVLSDVERSLNVQLPGIRE